MKCRTCGKWFNIIVGWPGYDCPECKDIFYKEIELKHSELLHKMRRKIEDERRS